MGSMELPQLEAFVEAARRGSFRRAAEALFLAQPSLTERIRRLEADLGQRLFHRLARGVVLTEAGKALLPFAESALGSVCEGREAVLAARRGSREALRVGASAVAMYVLPEILREFQSRHSVDLIVRSGLTDNVLCMVLRGEVDVGVAAPASHPHVETLLICHEQVVLVTPKGHPFSKQGQVSLRDVAGEPLIRYAQRDPFFPVVERAARAAGSLPNASMTVDDIEVAKHMIQRGLGVALMPLIAVRGEVEQGLVSIVRVVDAPGSAGALV